ncbi:hypothetical protein K8R47_01375 [archaeon]|nr:hypothetical protein [archaeon]
MKIENEKGGNIMKYYYMIGFFTLLLLINGCQPIDPSNDGTYLGGEKGVSVEFRTVAPPSGFDQGEDVPVKVLLKNEGEYDILADRALVKILGVNTDDFDLDNDYRGSEGTLKGKSDLLTEGGKQEIDFGTAKYKLDVTNSKDFSIGAKVCYPYQTKADVKVCMKSSIMEEAGEGICSLSGEKIISGSVSGAPIQIISLTQAAVGSRDVRFDITLENKDVGKFYDPAVDCEDIEDSITRLSNKDKVMLEIITPDDVTCIFRTGEEGKTGIVDLEDGIGDVTCRISLDEETSPYEDNLVFAVTYLYTDTTTKAITINEAR